MTGGVALGGGVCSRPETGAVDGVDAEVDGAEDCDDTVVAVKGTENGAASGGPDDAGPAVFGIVTAR